MTDVALIVLAVIFALTGIAKVAGVRFTKESFERFGLSDPTRQSIGVVEVGLAALAVIGLGANTVAAIAAVGALIIMVGAFRTHIRVKDSADQYLAATVVTAAAVVVLATL